MTQGFFMRTAKTDQTGRFFAGRTTYLSRLVTKPTKWSVRPAKTQISLGIRPVWSESSLPAWRSIGSSATHLAHCKDSGQTGRMPRLTWVFAGRTANDPRFLHADSEDCQTGRFFAGRTTHLSRLVTKQTKWSVRTAKTQISLGIRPVWSESSLPAWRSIASSATHLAYCKDSGHTGRMPRLIWAFAGRTANDPRLLHADSEDWSDWAVLRWAYNSFEPPRDKTNKMICAPSEDSNQPRHSPSLIRVFAARMKKHWVLNYPFSALQRFWSDWADAQADLGLRWVHTHFVGFVMGRFILLVPFHCVMQVSYLWTDIGDIMRWSQYTAYTGHVNDVTFHLTYITDSFLERKSRWKQLQLQWP